MTPKHSLFSSLGRRLGGLFKKEPPPEAGPRALSDRGLLAFSHTGDVIRAERLLRQQGFTTVAMALREDSLRLDDPRLLAAEKLAVVLGTEGDGLADGTIAQCDHTVMIPMTHGVDSLNVAAASAVAFYQLGLLHDRNR